MTSKKVKKTKKKGLKLNRDKTKYGYKKEGKSHFVIVAPHAAGDDLKSSVIARKLAKKLDAFLVVNNKCKKPTNTKAKRRKSQFIRDFNKLCWNNRLQKYVWGWRGPVMKRFFKDIAEHADQAKEFSQEKKATVIYIHSLKNHAGIGIDIGAGIKSFKTEDQFLFSFHNQSDNSGTATAKIRQIKGLKNILNAALTKDYEMTATIGTIHSGWSKSCAIQFHKHGGRDDYAIQFEINNVLRSNNENINYTVNLLADALNKIFI